MSLSTKYSATERELDELRYAIKKLKGMNDGVDHLWQVKETEYQNLNELMQDLKAHWSLMLNFIHLSYCGNNEMNMESVIIISW